MAVHIPLAVESQIEARVLMLSSNNILSPANGSPIIVPSQDIVLGVYYMTMATQGALGEGKVFANTDEVRSAYDSGAVDLRAEITLRLNGKRVNTTVGRVLLWEIVPKDNVLVLRHIMVTDLKEAEGIRDKIKAGESFLSFVADHSQSLDKKNKGLLGRVRRDEFERIFNIKDLDVERLYELEKGAVSDILVEEDARYHLFEVVEKHPAIPFNIVNKLQDKKTLRDLIDYAYRNLGPKATVILADRLKDLGYRASTEGGLSISIDAMIIPPTKWDILKKAENDVTKIGKQYTEGLITQGEKYNKVVDIWAKATEDVANEMMAAMKAPSKAETETESSRGGKKLPPVKETLNPIFMMADSGARGQQGSDAAACRYARPHGEAFRGNY